MFFSASLKNSLVQQLSGLALRRYFLLGHRVTNADESPVFIIGSGRSGTTLLRSVLVAHPDIAIPPESYVLPTIIKNFWKVKFKSWATLSNFVCSHFESHPQFRVWQLNLDEIRKQAGEVSRSDRSLEYMIAIIYKHYSKVHFGGTKMWGDKTPMNTLYLPFISAVFPSAKYIHIIRDGRDVVASFREAGLTDLLSACNRWNVSVQSACSFGRGRENYFELRYEEFVSKPEQSIRRICSFLNINFCNHMLTPHKTANKFHDVFAYKHLQNVLSPISINNIGKWKKTLDKDEAIIVNRLLEKNLFSLGY